VGAQELHNLREGHFIVVVGVNLSQQEFNFFLGMNDSHFGYQHFELGFTKDTLLHMVDFFEHVCEILKEFLVLLKLKVQDEFLKIDVEQLSLVFLTHHSNNFFTSDFL
jgi:hypothetical protein